MKYLIVIAVLAMSTLSRAGGSLPSQVLPAYKVAYRTISEKLGIDNFKVSYEYRIVYEDDQVIPFFFNGDFQNCIVDVRSESLKVESFSCTTHSKPNGSLVCDKNNYFIFLIDDGVFQLIGSSKYQLRNEWNEFHYSSYGTNDFISITFSEKNMEHAVLEQGLLWAYGDIDEDSIIKTDLSKIYCK